jgi:hypothetical protein
MARALRWDAKEFSRWGSSMGGRVADAWRSRSVFVAGPARPNSLAFARSDSGRANRAGSSSDASALATTSATRPPIELPDYRISPCKRTRNHFALTFQLHQARASPLSDLTFQSDQDAVVIGEGAVDPLVHDASAGGADGEAAGDDVVEPA